MSNVESPSDILRILPHRYPFLFVDRVTEFIPGQRIAATKRFSVNDEVSRGYLPASPVISVGILLELVTQLGAVLVMERPEMAGKVAVILQIPAAHLTKPVAPGDTRGTCGRGEIAVRDCRRGADSGKQGLGTRDSGLGATHSVHGTDRR